AVWGGGVEEVGDDAVLHEVQGGVDLPGGQEVAGGAGGVAGVFVVFGGGLVEAGFAVAVAGAQFGVQDLADQAVVAEGVTGVVEGDQEQGGGVDAAQHGGGVVAAGNRGAGGGGGLGGGGGVGP